jgi:hypothetical protein
VTGVQRVLFRSVLRAAGDRLQGRLRLIPQEPAQRRVLRLRRWNRRARFSHICPGYVPELNCGLLNCVDPVSLITLNKSDGKIVAVGYYN